MKENGRGYMCVFVCLRYSLLTSYNNMSRIPRVQQGGLHLHYTYIRIFSTEHFLHQERPRVFTRSSFIRGSDTMSKRGERPSLRFPHISHFHSATTLAFAAKRGGHRKRKKTRMERKKRAERITPNAPVCVCVRLPFPVSLKSFFFPCPVAPSTPFLSRFPSDARVINTILASCAKLFQPRRGLLRYDIIENKIRTHLLLGQSYPCCQSRCHTHTTLTSTPKSDIVCWNRPSLWLFSRA